MSGRQTPPRRRIDINLDEVIMATLPCTTEVIGCAWLLVCECVEKDLTIEGVLARPRAHARVFGLSAVRWKRLQAEIVTLAGRILATSPITVKYGRGSIPYAVRLAIYDRDGGVCVYCKAAVSTDDFHVDHVHPVARGGSDDEGNLACACRPCNLSKGAKTLLEWMGQ